MIRYAWNYYRNKKAALAVLFLLSIITSLVGIFAPYFNGQFIDGLITEPSVDTVVKFTVILCLLGVGGAIVAYISRLATVRLTSKIEYEMNADLIHHIQTIPLNQFYKKYTASQLSQRITTDTSAVTQFTVQNYALVVINIASFIVLGVLLFTINVPLLMLSCAFIPIYLCSYYFLRRPLYDVSINMREKHTKFFRVLFEQLNMVLSIKINASFDLSRNRIRQGFFDYLAAVMKNAKFTQLFTSIDTIISLAFQVCVLVIGGMQIIKGDMSIGEYTIVNTYFSMLLNIVKYYFGLGKSYQESKASYSRINEIQSISKEHNGSKQLNAIDRIEIKDVVFSYSNETELLKLSGKTLDFQRGFTYSLIGFNGTGKTTLLYILLGIIQEQSSGTVTFDSSSVENIDMYHLRRELVSVLLQNQVFPDMLVEDYLVSESGKMLHEIESIVRQTPLYDIYMNCEFDYRDLLNKKVDNLSGGEKQKIRLLQVLIKDSNVLVFDEPTTSLDAATIERLIEYIRFIKQSKTIIITNHDSRFDVIVDKSYNLIHNSESKDVSAEK